ncbi:MAG: energy transducer TonB [Rhodothermales bacterium]|nr:energy transducer TonB [Rhodothermales bacterium]
MRDSFLVGRFLAGRETVFRLRVRGRGHAVFSAETLRDRFEDRSDRFESRGGRYGVRLQAGYVVALVLLIVAFNVPVQQDSEFEINLAEQEVVELEEIVQTKQIAKPPPPPRPPVPVEVPDDELLDDDDLVLDASLDLAEVLDVPPPPPPVDEDVEEEEDLDEIFVAVEQMPEIIGGVEYLQSLVDYPELARKAQMEGMVVVRVIVNLDGTPSEPEVIRSAGAALDKAAVQAVMKLEFKPGRQRNRPVRTLMAIPVRFQLS